MARKRVIFEVVSPLGYRVSLTRDRWREITRFKHPAMSGHEKELADCLSDPEVIRASEKDEEVHLYYRPSGKNYLCGVVGGDPKNRFVITAYFTERIKQGLELWTK